MSSESDSCNSRHFSWLMKSCFPDPHHLPSPTSTSTAFLHRPTTISSLPDDLLLQFLSRIPPSSLPSVSLVCRRWFSLLDSSAFYQLRRLHGRLHLSVFVLSFSDPGRIFIATHRLGHDASWRTASLLLFNHVGCFNALSSHARLAAIGCRIYIIGKTEMLRCHMWTGTVTAKSKMAVSRNKFAAAAVAGKIYVAGGAARTAALEEYDPESNTWRVMSHAPRMRYGCLGASVDGVFYVIGGLKIGASSNEEVQSRASTGTGAHIYASSMDLYDVEARRWLRSRSVPGGGCVVAACAAGVHLYVLVSHAVELSFWRFNGSRQKGQNSASGSSSGGFGEWCRMKSPPVPAQIRLDSTVRFSCVGVGDKVVLIQVVGCIDDLLRRSGRSTRGLKESLVLVYQSADGEWSRGADLPEVIRRAACVCVEY